LILLINIILLPLRSHEVSVAGQDLAHVKLLEIQASCLWKQHRLWAKLCKKSQKNLLLINLFVLLLL
jgi:hypothetical protein